MALLFSTGDGITPRDVTWRNDRAEITIENPAADYRTYELRTSVKLRDGFPAGNRVRYSEPADAPTVRSGNDLFDGLFALAVYESREARSRDGKVYDPLINNGQGVSCDCFETGRSWRFVWTRDTSYAVHLGLAAIDPVYSRNSLLFKVSGRRTDNASLPGRGLEIIQDPGSGGSWPVSTDRVVWSLGAWELLKFLDGAERERFRDQAYEAISNTIENDRLAVYDPLDGLYRGEHSFLDWREQVYPSWTRDDTMPIGLSKTLSTNSLYYAALRIAANLAREKGLGDAASRYDGWARNLAEAVDRELWLEDQGLYSSLKLTDWDTAPARKFDLLGQSLAVITGIAEPAKARRISASYPFVAAGAPVIWPQQPATPIYHNQAIWPFVTSYALHASALSGNSEAFDRHVDTLVRGAALNLSNMENFEFLTQANFVDDGPLSGPVINSARQLWSVGGYVSMVLDGIFGLDAGQEGIRFRPRITASIRDGYFGSVGSLRLRGFQYRGKRIDLELRLPPAGSSGTGFLRPVRAWLNGSEIQDSRVSSSALRASNEWVVELAPGNDVPSRVRDIPIDGDGRLSRSDIERIWAPREPRLRSVQERDGRVRVRFDGNGESGVAFNIYRNGKLVAAGVPEGEWVDPDAAESRSKTSCYVVEAEYVSSGNRSHRTRHACRRSEAPSWLSVANQGLRSLDGATVSDEHGRPHFFDWGLPSQRIATAPFRLSSSGTYLLRLDYGNAHGPISTGITATVKKVEVLRTSDGRIVASGVLFMPHLQSWNQWSQSSPLRASLEGGEEYVARVSDYTNMSYLNHASLYTGGNGGASGALNRANISALTLERAPGE